MIASSDYFKLLSSLEVSVSTISVDTIGDVEIVFGDSATQAQKDLALAKVAEVKNSPENFIFRGVYCFSSVDVDNKVSTDIKDAIAPGRPRNLQIDAEQALQSKFAYAQAVGDTATVNEIKAFYETVVMPIRAEGNAFIAAHGW